MKTVFDEALKVPTMCPNVHWRIWCMHTQTKVIFFFIRSILIEIEWLIELVRQIDCTRFDNKQNEKNGSALEKKANVCFPQ